MRRAAAALAASAMLLAACGEDDPPRSTATTGTTPASTVPAGDREIDLRVRYDNAGRIASGRMVCRPESTAATGDLVVKTPTDKLCADARSLAGFLLAKPPDRRACTQIYGGPEKVRITGTIDGRKVDRAFRRTNGCEIEDFSRLTPILPLKR